MAGSLKRTLNEIIGLLFSMVFLGLMALTILLLIFLPLIHIDYIRDVIKLDSPREATPIIVLFVLSSLIYFSLRVKVFRKIYHWFPFLLPVLQIAFIMTVSTDIGLMFMNLWADHGVISKGLAITGTILSVIAGRAYMSYWYYKYPVKFHIQ